MKSSCEANRNLKQARRELPVAYQGEAKDFVTNLERTAFSLDIIAEFHDLSGNFVSRHKRVC